MENSADPDPDLNLHCFLERIYPGLDGQGLTLEEMQHTTDLNFVDTVLKDELL